MAKTRSNASIVQRLNMELVCHRYQEIMMKTYTARETMPKSYEAKPASHLSERVVKAIWYDRLFDEARITTVEGMPVKIFSQGEWNLTGGPDFKDALIRIGDADPVRGHVEIHVRSGDWKRHGHQTDPEYRDVILNVSLWHDDAEHSAYNDLDDPIPHVELLDLLHAPIGILADSLDIESYPFSSASRTGACSDAVSRRPGSISALLELAGHERMFSKARRLWEELHSSSLQEVMYNAIMQSLGYRPNKKAFRLLAACVPASVVRHIHADAPAEDRARILQSLYLGASGLFTNVKMDIGDEETIEYCSLLERHWKTYSPLLRGRNVPRREWRLAGMRPANFPLRRMAGAGELMGRIPPAGFEDMLAEFASKLKHVENEKENNALLSAFRKKIEQPAAGYWEHRIVPGGEYQDSVPALIGQSLSSSILLNIFYPLLLCRARRAGDNKLGAAALASFALHPTLERHQISRLMRHRLWGDESGGASLMKREIIQQGLMQVFFDFCDGNTKNCSKCRMHNILEEGIDADSSPFGF